MTAVTGLRLNEGVRIEGVRIEGVVEHGDERGRRLGFPTANLEVGSEPVGDGVWAGLVELGPDELHVAAVSIGHRPTYYGREVSGCSRRTCWTSRVTCTAGGWSCTSSPDCVLSGGSPTRTPWFADCGPMWARCGRGLRAKGSDHLLG